MKAVIKLLLIILIGTISKDTIRGQNVQAVWMYKFDTWKAEPDFGNRIYSVSALGMNQIYLGVLSHKLDEPDYESKIIAFVNQAKALNIAVHAMTLQDPHFSLAYKHDDALVRIQDILQYNIGHPGAAFTGIHIDPEPHILLCSNDSSHVCNSINWETLTHALWTSPPEETALAAVNGEIEDLAEPMKTDLKAKRAEIMTDFNTLLQRIRDSIDIYNTDYDPDVIFSSTVGWWYNEKSTGAPNGYLPSGANTLTSYLDVIIPMVYSGGVGEDTTDIISRVIDEIRDSVAPTIIGISKESLENFPGGVLAAIAGLNSEFENDAAYQGVAAFKFADLVAAPPDCPTTIFTNDLRDWVGDNIIRNLADPDHPETMPRESTSEGDDYDEPSLAQLVLWEDMLTNLLATNISEACGLANLLGYELIDLEENSGEKYYVLRTVPYHETTNPDPHFWGTYILNQNPRQGNLIIQAPHPLIDANTGRQGLEVLRLTGALFFMMSGTNRCNLMCNTLAGEPAGPNCSICAGSTSVCHSGSELYRYPISDMAHTTSSVFYKTTEILGAYPSYFIQLHGFGHDTGDPLAVLSNGSSLAPAGFDPLPILREKLLLQLGLSQVPDTICVAHITLPPSGSTCAGLRGFNNTQGRLLNGDLTPCQTEESSLMPSGKFIHFEQAEAELREFRSDHQKVARAIANTFVDSEFTIAPIANTSGLLNPENFEPEAYDYNFIGPLRSELLCKNNHLATIPTATLTGAIPSATYEDVGGVLSSSGTISSTERVWFIAENSMVLTEGFEAKAEDFFIAELKNEQNFCNTPNLYLADDFHYRFFTSIYGPRMTSNGGLISRPYDFHRGEDIVDMEVPTGIMPDIFCMCDGTVDRVFDQSDLPPGVEIENTGEGQYVVVKCDAMYKGGGLGNIYIAYRHLSAFADGLSEGQLIRKGDLIGKMGKTGITTSPHLHLSALKKVGSQFINLHPMRLFNNAFNRHLNLPVDEPPTSIEEAEMKKERVNVLLLDHSSGSTNTDDNYATFRIAVPYNKTAIRAIIIRNGAYEKTADFEAISESRDNQESCCNTNPFCTDTCLDNPMVGQLKLFPLPFVRAEFSAYNRYNSIKGDICDMTGHDVCDHPALNFPVKNEGIFTTPAYVLDIKAKGLAQFFNPYDFEIDVLDIWGNGVRGTLTPPPPLLNIQKNTSANQLQTQVATLGKTSSLTESFQAKEDFKVKIYPNPSAGNELFVEIEGLNPQVLEITISTLSGQVALTRTGSGNPYKIDVGALPAGVYLVRIKTERLNFAEKFIRN